MKNVLPWVAAGNCKDGQPKLCFSKLIVIRVVENSIHCIHKYRTVVICICIHFALDEDFACT